MKRISVYTVVVFILLLLFSACRKSDSDFVSTEPVVYNYEIMEGVVTRVRSGTGQSILDFIEMDATKRLFTAKWRIRLSETGEIWYFQNSSLKLGSKESLKNGQIVKIYVTEILESYPGKATAIKIFILEEDPVTLKEPLSNRYPAQFEGVFEEIVTETTFEDKYGKTIEEYYLFNGNEIGEASKSMKVRFYFPEHAIIWRKVGDSYELASIEDVKIGKRFRILTLTHPITRIDEAGPWTVIEAVILD